MRPNADVIKAWADGAEVQFQDNNGVWFDTTNPTWRQSIVYRIKPNTVSINDVEKYNVVVGDFWLTKDECLVPVAHVTTNRNKFITTNGEYVDFDQLKTLMFRANTLNILSGVVYEDS
jgi:hypothetical protein